MVISINHYEKSSTYKLVKDIIEITEPLKNIGVSYFIYAELDLNCSIRILVNNDSMIRDFINNFGLKYELSLSPYKMINNGLHTASFLTKSNEINDYYANIFKLNKTTDQIIYIIDSNNIRKIYIFGINDLFLVNREYLELFTLYFSDQAAKFINSVDLVPIPQGIVEYHLSLKYINFIDDIKSRLNKMEEEFLNRINAKYYKIKQLQQKYFLSARETQCLELILQNKLAKEIANYLNLTVRTTETYIDNLRRKLHCRNKNEIMVKFFIK